MRVTEVLPAAQGGNRVTETVYNADDSVHQVKRAVGTALAQTYATTTYSANGLPEGVFAASKGFSYGWMDLSGRWLYAESIFASTTDEMDNYYF